MTRVIAFTLVAVIVAVTSAASAQSTPPEEVLKSKGLTKSGTVYVLEADLKLPESLRVMRQAKKTLDDNTRKRKMLQSQIKDAQNTLGNVERRYREVLAAIKPGLSAERHNALVAEAKTLESHVRDGAKFLKGKEQELKNLVPPTDDYVQSVIELAARMEAAQQEYERLAKDPQVARAIDELSKKPPRVRLGPSPQFAQEYKPTLKARDALSTSAVPLEVEGGIAYLDVTFNGSVKERMVLDSGASAVVLSAQQAKKLGLVPGADDDVVTIVIADGSKSEAHRMTIKSVRVGQFTVSDVDCIVLPPSAKNAEGLLGGTFLQHFAYRIDMTSALLHLSPNSPQVTTAVASAAERNKPPTVKPPTPAAATKPAAASPDATVAGGGGEIDLLAKVDLKRDAVAGQWQQTADGLVSDASQGCRLKLPVTPPAEYDFVVEFTRQSGSDAVAQHLVAGDHRVMWAMSLGRGTADGFDAVGNAFLDTGTNKPSRIKTGQRHRSVVRVRNDSITASIDGHKVSAHKGGRDGMHIPNWWSIGSERLIGVGTWESPTVFHSIKLIPAGAAAGSQPAKLSSTQPSLFDVGGDDAGVELLSMMTGDTGRKDPEGAIVLNDGEQITSPQKYRAPVTFKIVARTSSTDLRIGAMADQIIFNWRDNPAELRIDGGPAGGRHRPDAGKIPVNQWVEVEIKVTRNEMLISVDGEQRHRVQANFSRVNRPLIVFPAVGSTIKVKSVRVVQGK